ncbi:MAG TPA: cytochrome c [Chitinophagales bacterium]|nr:cytochrome c [Chitinophagales bacterium]
MIVVMVSKKAVITKQIIHIKKSVILFSVIGIVAVTSCKKTDVVLQQTNYFPQVKTIIQKNCISCHYQGGQGMPIILTDDSDIVNRAASIKAATCDTPTLYNKRMPLGGELSDADKATITAWFEKGGTASD